MFYVFRVLFILCSFYFMIVLLCLLFCLYLLFICCCLFAIVVVLFFFLVCLFSFRYYLFFFSFDCFVRFCIFCSIKGAFWPGCSPLRGSFSGKRINKMHIFARTFAPARIILRQKKHGRLCYI